MKKVLYILIGLFLTTSVYATNVSPILLKPTLWERFTSSISRVIECKWHLSCYFNLGTSLTTITGTETVSYALKTTVNNNFTALNTGKIEVSTTSVGNITTLSNLTTIGTITSGVWSGTTIAVAKGGTGSTTLASNQILLGNGTGNIGIVSGFGTSGQFLTSNGAGSAPTWQTSSVSQSDNYSWTGYHSFSNTVNMTGSSLAKSLNASSTVANPMVLNGVSYNMPTSDGASTSALMTDGSGGLTWNTWSGKATSTGSVTISNTVSSDSDTHTIGFRPRMIIINLDGVTSGCSVNSQTVGQVQYIDGPGKTDGQYYGWRWGADTADAQPTDPSDYDQFDIVTDNDFRIDTAGANLVDGYIDVTNVTGTTFGITFTRTDTGGSGCSATISYNLVAIE